MQPSAPASPRRAALRLLVAAPLLALLFPVLLAAQVRERPVPFDSVGRVMAVTPPLAARLALEAPAWPVTGDYLDARLYAIGEIAESYVIVVRRQRDAVDRYPISVAQRDALLAAISRGDAGLRAGAAPDNNPTIVSEPVRGQFVASQTALGALLFGPAAAALISDDAASGAAWLLVTGGSFFYSAAITQSTPVSRAQNHLAYHSAFRGALAGNLALLALGGDGLDDKAYTTASLVGGIAGDVIGFQLARPMTDAEAHGTSHGSTVATAITVGTLGTLGAYDSNQGGRIAAASILTAGALGYPLGLRYVRTARYRVTAGDVSALFISELLGTGAAATLIPDNADEKLGFGLVTAGFAAGAVLGDRLLVRPFDHSDSDARLLSLGTGAGALMGIALPALARSGDGRAYVAAGTAGGILGAIFTERLIAPARAHGGDAGPAERRTGAKAPRVDVQWNPQALVLAGTGVQGRHSLLTVGF